MKKIENTTNNTETTSNAGFFGSMYLFSIIFLIAAVLGTVVELFTGEYSEESLNGLMFALCNFILQKYLFDQKLQEFKEKKEAEEKEDKKEPVMKVHNPKEDLAFAIFLAIFAIVFLGVGLYFSYDTDGLFLDMEGKIIRILPFLFSGLLIFASVDIVIDYFGAINEGFRKKLPMRRQKRIEDSLKPQKEVSLEEDVLKFREWLNKKLS